MTRLSSLVFVLLIVVILNSISANNVIYSVTFVSCVQGSTCPQGNPLTFNRTFALNGTISPNITASVGDRLEFDLMVNVSIHPLAICRNSPPPNFCLGVSNNDTLSTKITLAGTNTSVTFTTAGIYYYGCYNHPGMGATINVVQTTTSALLSSTKTTGYAQQLSSSFLFIIGIPLLTIIFFI